MRRKYINKVEVWVNAVIDDGFSGSINDPVIVSSSWCNVSTVPSDKITNYGLDIGTEVISIKTRWRSYLDYFTDGLFFKYKGYNWMPTRIFNKDLVNEEITIIASR